MKFEGVFPILATPFDANEALDLDSLTKMVGFMAGLGVDGITILGVLGESNRLLDQERDEVIRAAVAAAGKTPVIVGTSYTGTLAAAKLAERAQALGAAAVMVAPSYEATPNEQRIFEYFQRIAASVSIPIVAQDHPPSTQVHMSVALLLRLVNEIPQIACMKEEAPPTLGKITQLLYGMTGRKVPILTALGALYSMFELERGASGFNTGFAFPEVLMAMVKHAREGNWQRARELYQRFLPLIVFEQQPGAAIRKEILRMRGLIASNRVRHPGAGIDAATSDQLAQLIAFILPGVDIRNPLQV